MSYEEENELYIGSAGNSYLGMLVTGPYSSTDFRPCAQSVSQSSCAPASKFVTGLSRLRETRTPYFLGAVNAFDSVGAFGEGSSSTVVCYFAYRVAGSSCRVQCLIAKPWLTAQTSIEARDLDRIVAALRVGSVGPENVRILAMGSVLSHLLPTELAPLIDALLDSGTGGYWAAVEIMGMYAYQKPERFEGLRKQIRRMMAAF